jgi:hypothetical protein
LPLLPIPANVVNGPLVKGRLFLSRLRLRQPSLIAFVFVLLHFIDSLAVIVVFIAAVDVLLRPYPF